MTQQVLLRGANVASTHGVEPLDILIESERIAAVAPRLADSAPQAEVIDLTGLTVLPGLIDAHVHLREPGGEHKEDFDSGTRAALAGGVTTVLAMPNTSPPITNCDTFEQANRLAAAKAVCDYGLYIGATADNAAEAASLADRAAGLKMYVGSSTGSLLVDHFAAQIAHFEGYPADRVIAVHAEDEAAVRYYATRGQRRPPICAALSVAYLLALAEQTGRRLHICHVSTRAELDLIREAKARGVPVTCEATPHHLFLTLEAEARIGALAVCNPPLREQADVDALWANLDVLDIVATDHAPHTLDEKRGDQPPSGMPGLETMLPLLLTAVHEGRLTLPDVVRLTATRLAEIFGLGRKGRIEPGCDADLTVVDLSARWTLGDAPLYTRCGWTPFAGREVRGRVERVYLRGRQVFDGERVLAGPGTGQPVIDS